MSDELPVLQVRAHLVCPWARRDRAAMGELFFTDGRVQRRYDRAGRPRPTGVTTPNPPSGRSHPVTHAPKVVVDGDPATIPAQVIVFQVHGAARSAGEGSLAAFGEQGRLPTIASGASRPLRRRAEPAV